MMRKISIKLATLMLILLSAQLIPGVLAGGIGDQGSASFTYDLGTYSEYNFIDTLDDDGEQMGDIEIYNDDTYIYIRIKVYSKPYLAYGELDKNGDGVIDADKYDVDKHGNMKGDKNKDGVIDKYDLKSDGVTIEGLGDPHGSEASGYIWCVDSHDDDSPKKYRDPEITVPSWTDQGMLVGPIVYIAKIPIPSGETYFSIDINKVHASPPMPNFVIPEVPYGTIMSVVGMLAVLVAKNRTKINL